MNKYFYNQKINCINIINTTALVIVMLLGVGNSLKVREHIDYAEKKVLSSMVTSRIQNEPNLY